MTDEIENRLRRALRPIDAPADLADRILARLPERPVVVALPVREIKRGMGRYWMPGALAASLVAAVLLGQNVAERRADSERQAGLAASRELMEALRVTSRKLDVAYHAVKQPSETDSGENQS
jgi:hypothetical protein